MITPTAPTSGTPATPAARPAADSSATGSGTAFATLLQQSQPAASAPTQASGTAKAADEAKASTEAGDTTPDEVPDAPETPAATATRGAAKTKGRVADKATDAAPDEKTDSSPLAGAAADAARAARATDAADASSDRSGGDKTAIDPALAQWLASLNLRHEPMVPTPGSGIGAGGKAAAESPAGSGVVAGSTEAGTDRGVADPRSAALKAGREAADTRAAGVTGTDAGERADASQKTHAFALALSSQAVMTQAPARDADAAGHSPADASVAALAAGAAFQPVAGGTAPDPAAVAVNLPTPVQAPEFAQALGVSLSLLAKGGVQQAELHLNPADMGPVSVHIVMDGTQARVEFGADVAATRHAIEAGMPELAGALRDAGFTLAGGGVSQHSRGQGDGSRQGEGRGTGQRSLSVAGAGADGQGTASTRRTVSLGGVDLYA